MEKETKKVDYDIANEALIIGSFYSSPDLYIEYGSKIRSKYDFYDENSKFLFDCFELYYTTFSQEIKEERVNTFMMKDSERKLKYKKLGGWKSISQMISISNEDDFENYYDTLKKYSLIRELGRKGFPVERLLSHPKFDKIKSHQVVMSMRASLDKIQTVIGGGSDSLILGSDMTSAVIGWRQVPEMGIELPFPMWTDLFRGWRKKKLIVDGMLSNEGKSRRMTRVACWTSLFLNKPVLIMANEMDESDLKSAMIATVCNNEEFMFNYNIPERVIVLGEYESEEQFQKVMEVAQYIEENTKIHYKDMDDYSDKAIEHEIRKHVLGLGVEYVFYDTLKGHRSDNWETVKQTTTKIRDLVKELNVGGYATIQLTDDSLFVDIFDFSSNNIANAKQLKHVVDHLILEKSIPKDEYDNYAFVDDWEQECPLDRNKIYYGQKVDKNRGGGKGMVLCTEVNLDLNTWKEVGLMVKSDFYKKKNSSGKYGKK